MMFRRALLHLALQIQDDLGVGRFPVPQSEWEAGDYASYNQHYVQKALADSAFYAHWGDRERWERAKRDSEAFRSYVEQFRAIASPGELDEWFSPALMERWRNCGNLVFFEHYWTQGEVRAVRSWGCKAHRLCHLCALRRSAKLAHVLTERVGQVRGDSMVCLHTYTVRDSDSLEEAYESLRGLLRGLTTARRLARNGNRHVTEWDKIEGAFWSIEIKRGVQSGKWHPHVHMLALQSDYIDVRLLQTECQRLTGQDWVNFHVGMLRGEVIDAVCETVKYTLKFDSMTFMDRLEVYDFLRRKRTLGSLGTLYGVKEPEGLDEDSLADFPYVVRILRWLGSKYFLEKPCEGLDK